MLFSMYRLSSDMRLSLLLSVPVLRCGAGCTVQLCAEKCSKHTERRENWRYLPSGATAGGDRYTDYDCTGVEQNGRHASSTGPLAARLYQTVQWCSAFTSYRSKRTQLSRSVPFCPTCVTFFPMLEKNAEVFVQCSRCSAASFKRSLAANSSTNLIV